MIRSSGFILIFSCVPHRVFFLACFRSSEMRSGIRINIDEEQHLLQNRNEMQVLWTAQLVPKSGCRWFESRSDAAGYIGLTVTIVPTFIKQKKSYIQAPKSKFCGLHEVYLFKGNSQVPASHEEMTHISVEECLKFQLVLKNEPARLTCVLIRERGERPGEYLYIYPSSLELSVLREIIARPCRNILERMVLLATSGIVRSELQSLTHLYNYCENNRPLNSTPGMIGNIALLTTFQLVDDFHLLRSPRCSHLTPVQEFVNRLIFILVALVMSMQPFENSSGDSQLNFLKNSKQLESFYKSIESKLFAPLKIKTNSQRLIYPLSQFIKSFIWFLVIFPIIFLYTTIVSCIPCSRSKNMRIGISCFLASLMSLLLYFSVGVSGLFITVYYIYRDRYNNDIITDFWMTFVFSFYALTFFYVLLGPHLPYIPSPRFVSIKSAHDKGKLLMLHRNQMAQKNMDFQTDNFRAPDVENEGVQFVDFQMSSITEKYQKVSKSVCRCLYIFSIFWGCTISSIQLTVLLLSDSKTRNISEHNSTNNNSQYILADVLAGSYLLARFVSFSILASTIFLCIQFYYKGYCTVKGILEKLSENDYAGSNTYNEFDVKKPKSLEYLLALVHVIIGDISHSLSHLIMISFTVIVLFVLAVVALITYIQDRSPIRTSVISSIIFTISLGVPTVIMLIYIALINTMVTTDLRKILEVNKQQLVNQIVTEQLTNARPTTTNQPVETDKMRQLIAARDYLHEQIHVLTSQAELEVVKLFGLITIDRKLLISVSISAIGGLITWLLSLGRK